MDRRTTYTGICHGVDWRDWINPVDSTPCTYRADVESLHELKLVLHTSDGYLTFRIEFEKLGYHSKPNLKLVWWQQRGDFLYIVLYQTLYSRDCCTGKSDAFYLLSVRVNRTARGKWEFREIPERRKRDPDDVRITSFEKYDLHVSRTHLNNNAFYKGTFLSYLCKDILSIIDSMVEWPLRASDIVITFTTFTRSNVKIQSSIHGHNENSRADLLFIPGKCVMCFQPGLGIVFMSENKIVLYGTEHCGYGPTNALYEYSYERGFVLLKDAELYEFLTPVSERPSCPLFSLRKSTISSTGWFAVYSNPTGNWLRQDIDVSDVTIDNYRILSVGGHNYRISLKPNAGGRAVRCVIDRSGKLLFY